MLKKPYDLPMQIYHRIFRFAQRNVEPERIAFTLDLPLKTVQRVLDRFETSRTNGEHGHGKSKKSGSDSIPTETFLDLYVIPKARYVVADVSGWVTQEHRQKFQEELEKLIKSQWKVVALLMRDVLAMDETGVEDIQSLNEKLNSRGRFAAILDPSPSIEPLISEHKLEEKISIYGTEKAFEQEVFSIRRVNKTRILPIRK